MGSGSSINGVKSRRSHAMPERLSWNGGTFPDFATGQLTASRVNPFVTPTENRAQFLIGFRGEQTRVAIARLAFHAEWLRRTANCGFAEKLAPIPHRAERALQLFRQFPVSQLAEQRTSSFVHGYCRAERGLFDARLSTLDFACGAFTA
jgi:hypothetical protein